MFAGILGGSISSAASTSGGMGIGMGSFPPAKSAVHDPFGSLGNSSAPLSTPAPTKNISKVSNISSNDIFSGINNQKKPVDYAYSDPFANKPKPLTSNINLDSLFDNLNNN